MDRLKTGIITQKGVFEMPDMFNFSDEMKNYFNTLPKAVQEAMMQSGVQISNVADMQALVQNLQGGNSAQ